MWCPWTSLKISLNRSNIKDWLRTYPCIFAIIGANKAENISEIESFIKRRQFDEGSIVYQHSQQRNIRRKGNYKYTKIKKKNFYCEIKLRSKTRKSRCLTFAWEDTFTISQRTNFTRLITRWEFCWTWFFCSVVFAVNSS